MKTIFKTPEESRNGKHIEGETGFLCHDCGEVYPTGNPGCGSGYAVCDDGKHLVCYTCADKRQVEGLKDRSKPFSAYVSGDGKRITTWTGGTLMTVTQSWPCQLIRASFTHSKSSYKCIRARDVHGALWYGRGSAGVRINLRPCKG